jgi:hypothetical protein
MSRPYNGTLIGPRLKGRGFISKRTVSAHYRETHPEQREKERIHAKERVRERRRLRLITPEQKARDQQCKNRHWQKNKDVPEFKLKNKNSRLKSVYGITLEQYNEMLRVQNNCCAICERQFTERLRICVDHDHTSAIKNVRQLLCDWCNTGLGKFQDSATWLRRAADYVERFSKL